MFIAVHGVKHMLISIHGVTLMLIAIHGVKLCAHCYTWSEALCALL